jgi:polyphosphate kinase
VHLGTGNYNPKTAKLYTDFSLFSAREDITEDVANLFNALTGFGRAPEFKQLLVAPYCLHAKLQELIDHEAANAIDGKPARIIAKINSLVDKATIDRLYAASKAGVKIDLIVRGVCCLVPGVEGLSENIRVRSIVGRYLEHARVYFFENAGGEPKVFMGSADWMPRNFFRRIEVVFPVLDPVLRRWMIESYLPVELQDNVDARELQSNGAYTPVARAKGEADFSAQRYFIASAHQRARQI